LTQAVSTLLALYLENDHKLVALKQVRPSFDDLHFDNSQQVAFALNTLSTDRFERLRCHFGEEKVEGNLLVSKLGMALFDRKHLEHSMTVTSLELSEREDGYSVENRYYKIIVSKEGRIVSWKDKRTKN